MYANHTAHGIMTELYTACRGQTFFIEISRNNLKKMDKLWCPTLQKAFCYLVSVEDSGDFEGQG